MLYQTFESQVTHEIQSLKFCYVEKLKSGPPPLLEKSNFLNLHREITEYMTPPPPPTPPPPNPL